VDHNYQFSVIIPVWNGAAVLTDCLESIYAYSADELLEVICVDNASHDKSAQVIAEYFPQVRLVRQLVNLGFAGGINTGIEIARGDVFVLLNQDCIVQPSWLTAIAEALLSHPECGIAGCTIFNADGTLNHVGALIRRPDIYGQHLTRLDDDQPHRIEYVTGAAMAIRREAWQIVGSFDEDYYPAYFEESDYCFRARRKNIETILVPAAHVKHLQSSREWQTDPVKHTINQHRSRYRFVSKHLSIEEAGEFFAAEAAAIESERYFDQAVARVLAARATLRNLSDILERRKLDLEDVVSPAEHRLLQVGFAQILRRSFAIAKVLSRPHLPDRSNLGGDEWQGASQKLRALQQQEYDLMKRIYFIDPAALPESTAHRLFRLLVLRPLSFLSGREHLLLARLNSVHVLRLDEHVVRLDEHEVRLDEYEARLDELDQLYRSQLALLELLTDYDYT
jgi:GT2 family glycosyltransferase